jgi:hypothetical protein
VKGRIWPRVVLQQARMIIKEIQQKCKEMKVTLFVYGACVNTRISTILYKGLFHCRLPAFCALAATGKAPRALRALWLQSGSGMGWCCRLLSGAVGCWGVNLFWCCRLLSGAVGSIFFRNLFVSDIIKPF